MSYFSPQAPSISSAVSPGPGNTSVGSVGSTNSAAEYHTPQSAEAMLTTGDPAMDAMLERMLALGSESEEQRSELAALEDQLEALQSHRAMLGQLQELLETNKDDATIDMVAKYLETLAPGLVGGPSGQPTDEPAHLEEPADLDEPADEEDAEALYAQYEALLAEKAQLEAMRDSQLQAQAELTQAMQALSLAEQAADASPSAAQSQGQAAGQAVRSPSTRAALFSPARAQPASVGSAAASGSAASMDASTAASMPVEQLEQMRKAHMHKLRRLQQQLRQHEDAKREERKAHGHAPAQAAPPSYDPAGDAELMAAMDKEGIYNLLALMEDQPADAQAPILDALAQKWERLQSQFAAQHTEPGSFNGRGSAAPSSPSPLSASFAGTHTVMPSPAPSAPAPRPATVSPDTLAQRDQRTRDARDVHAAFAEQAAEMEALQSRIGSLFEMLDTTRQSVEGAAGAFAGAEPVHEPEDGSTSEWSQSAPVAPLSAGYYDDTDAEYADLSSVPESAGAGAADSDSATTKFLHDELAASNVKLQDIKLAVSYAKSLPSAEEKRVFFKDFVRYFNDSYESDTEGVSVPAASPSGRTQVVSFDDGPAIAAGAAPGSSHPRSSAPLLAELNAGLGLDDTAAAAEDDDESAVYAAVVGFVLSAESEPKYVARLFDLLSQFNTPVLRVRVLATLKRLLEDIATEAAYLDEDVPPGGVAPKVGSKRHSVVEPESGKGPKRARRLREMPAVGPESRLPVRQKRTRPVPVAPEVPAVLEVEDEDPTSTVIRNRIMEEMQAVDQLNYFIQNVQNSPNPAGASDTASRPTIKRKRAPNTPRAEDAPSSPYDYAEDVDDDDAASLPSEMEGETAEASQFYESSGGERHVLVTPAAPVHDELAAARQELEYHQARKSALEQRKADLLRQQQEIIQTAVAAGLDPEALGLTDLADLDELDDAYDASVAAAAAAAGEDPAAAAAEDDDETTASMEATMTHIMQHYAADIYINEAILNEFANLFKALAQTPETGGKFTDYVLSIIESIFVEFKYEKLGRPVDADELASYRAVMDRYKGADMDAETEAVIADLKDMLFTHLITLSLTSQLASEQATHDALTQGILTDYDQVAAQDPAATPGSPATDQSTQSVPTGAGFSRHLGGNPAYLAGANDDGAHPDAHPM